MAGSRRLRSGRTAARQVRGATCQRSCPRRHTDHVVAAERQLPGKSTTGSSRPSAAARPRRRSDRTTLQAAAQGGGTERQLLHIEVTAHSKWC